MKRVAACILFACFSMACFAQNATAHKPAVNYQVSLEKADLAFSNKDYLTAKRFYKQALAAHPAEKYPKEQIDKCDRKMSNGNWMTTDWDCPCMYGHILKGASPVINKNVPGSVSISSNDSLVHCAFPGIVAAVTKDTGNHVVSVVIKHGKYFASYSNLASVHVNLGDDLNEGDIIGVPCKQNGLYLLEFAIWHGKEQEDASTYVRCK